MIRASYPRQPRLLMSVGLLRRSGDRRFGTCLLGVMSFVMLLVVQRLRGLIGRCSRSSASGHAGRRLRRCRDLSERDRGNGREQRRYEQGLGSGHGDSDSNEIRIGSDSLELARCLPGLHP